MSQHLDFGQLSIDPTFLHDCYMSNVLIILDFFLRLKEVCFWGFPHNLRKSFKMFGPRKCYPRCVNSILVLNLLNPKNNFVLNVLCCTSLERTKSQRKRPSSFIFWSGENPVRDSDTSTRSVHQVAWSKVLRSICLDMQPSGCYCRDRFPLPPEVNRYALVSWLWLTNPPLQVYQLKPW